MDGTQRAVFVFLALSLAASTPAQAPAAPGEMAVKDEPVTFRSRVNLIMVPVVVRDRSGKAVPGLKIDNFVLSDSGKPQFIAKFSVEKTGAAPKSAAVTAQPADPGAESTPPPPIAPDHFTVYLFDDVHGGWEDLVRARDAAFEQIIASVQPSHRAAIFTTSGQGIVDFTDDRAKLRDALMQLRARPIARSSLAECPDIPYYLADAIQNKNDSMALAAMIQQAIVCANLQNPGAQQAAESMVRGAAQRALSTGEHESRVALSVIKDAIRRLSASPGQRSIILASPGFFTTITLQSDKSDVIDRAIRANVVINSLDIRGLYVDPSIDASRPNLQGGVTASTTYFRYLRESASAASDVLLELSSGTGGTAFQNRNDLSQGFQRLASPPEYIYMLGFSPQNLKLDGKYHPLKVTLKNAPNLTFQARRGYFAPRTLATAAETAKQEIEEALFSREEMRDIPVELHTQFFKRDMANARLSVMSRIDVRQLKYRKDADRNCNQLTVVTALFDRNGNYVQANTQTVEMRLLDETLSKRLTAGLPLRTSFDVHPGPYAIRVVIRDSEGQLMSAANGSVEIP